MNNTNSSCDYVYVKMKIIVTCLREIKACMQHKNCYVRFLHQTDLQAVSHCLRVTLHCLFIPHKHGQLRTQMLLGLVHMAIKQHNESFQEINIELHTFAILCALARGLVPVSCKINFRDSTLPLVG